MYVVISVFANGSTIRRKAIIAGVSCGDRLGRHGRPVVMIEDWMHESKEEFRFQAREGFTVVEQGNQIKIERTARNRWS